MTQAQFHTIQKQLTDLTLKASIIKQNLVAEFVSESSAEDMIEELRAANLRLEANIENEIPIFTKE